MPERIRVRTRVRGEVYRSNPRFKAGNEQKVALVGTALETFPHLQVEILGRHGMRADGICELNNQTCIQDISGFGSTQQDGQTVITEVSPRKQLKGCANCPVNRAKSA